MTKYIKTAEKIEVDNYPYGFRLRTTLTDSIEFNPKKGYRHTTQTIDPRNGKINKPKKSTYYPLLVRYYNEENHIKTTAFYFNGNEEINTGLKFIAENFDLFTPDEISYLYSTILGSIGVSMKAQIIYCGSDIEALKPLYGPIITGLTSALKAGVKFEQLLPIQEIEAAKIPDFNPFKVKGTTSNYYKNVDVTIIKRNQN